jgi:putative ABC transport system permease protein
MDGFAQDLRYGWRSLTSRPGFTLVAVLTLALGIAVNTTMFSVVSGVLLAELPYRDPERLALIRVSTDGQTSLPSVAPPEVEDLRERAGSVFEDAASIRDNAATLTGVGEPTQLQIGGIRWNFLELLGVEPFLGRAFTAEDGLQNAAPVVLLAHGLWQERFGGDPGIVGRTIVLDGQATQVVGVLPAKLELLLPREAGLPRRLDAWRPFAFDFHGQPRFRWMRGLVRLRPGVGIEQAQQATDRLAQELISEFPAYKQQPFRFLVHPLHADLVSSVRRPVLVLFGAVAFVLLIACGNVANLLLARAAEREHEIGARAALGASRGRLVRQLLTEGLLLAGVGAALGVLIAQGLIDLLVRLAPADLPRFDAVRLDARVFAFTLGASLLTVLVFALVPALQTSRVDLHEAVKGGARLSGSESRARFRRLLVAGEIALSLVLLVGAGLLIRSFAALQGARPGFEPDQLVTFQLALPNLRYPDPPDHARFFEDFVARLQAQPGIDAASASFPLPMSGRFWTNEYAYDPGSEESWGAVESDNHVVLPGYFHALGARLLEGRELAWEDITQGRPVVVIDDRLAARAFPGQDPLGRYLTVRSARQERVSAEVVGVVEHVRQDHPGRDGREQTYVTLSLWPFSALYFAVRSPLRPERVVAIVREELRQLDPQLALYDVRSLRGYIAQVTAGQRFAMQLLGLFAVLAVALAGIGLYGTIAYTVSQRDREFGIRMALGAGPRELLRLVVRQGLGLAGLGIGIGIAAALLLSRVLQSLLYGVSPADPATYAAIVVVVAALALLASYLPARRAAHLHPASVLRSE